MYNTFFILNQLICRGAVQTSIIHIFANNSPNEYANSSPNEYANSSPNEYANNSPNEYANSSPNEYANNSPNEYAKNILIDCRQSQKKAY